MRRTIIRRLTLTAATMLATLAFAAPAWAAPFTVTKTADTNDGACTAADCSLREAVSASNVIGQFDTIEFAPGARGTITLDAAKGGLSILGSDTQLTSLTINGPGAGALAVSGGDATRPFGIASGARATINGLTIKDGKTPAGDAIGGGVKNNGALTLNRSTVSGNEASSFGGGIYNQTGGTVTLNDSTVSANASSTYGGGLYNGGTLTLNNSTVNGVNTASHGGGLFNSYGTLTLNNSTVSGNTAGDYGGGLFNDGGTLTLNNSTVSTNKAIGDDGGGIFNNDAAGGTLSLDDSTVSGNEARYDGGGIRNDGTLTLNDSTISGNTANDDGGGIANSGPLTLNDSTVSGNTANDDGGGISSNTNLTDTTTTIRNSTISGNTADDPGGGVYNRNGLTRIENSTVTRNTAPIGSGVASRSNTDTSTEVLSTIVSANTNNNDVGLFDGSTNSFDSDGFNLIGRGDATGAFNNTGDRTGITNPGLGPLRNNGGPTPTHALLGASPALDTGDPNCPPPAADQRGVIRPQRGTCDIGSFERRNSAPAARNDSYGGVEDRTLNVPARGVLRNDTDAEGDALRAARVSGPGKGKLTLRLNGSFAYKPPKNFNGVARFVYRASDGKGGADNATATIRVRARPG